MKKSHHFIKLTAEARKDIQAGQEFIDNFNGKDQDQWVSTNMLKCTVMPQVLKEMLLSWVVLHSRFCVPEYRCQLTGCIRQEIIVKTRNVYLLCRSKTCRKQVSKGLKYIK